jgi:hypothetical protein
MGAIAFSKNSEDSWVVAGWAFRQVLDDVASHCPTDAEVIAEFTEAKAISGLIVYELRPELARRVTSCIRQVVAGILSGSLKSGIHDQPYSTANRMEEYRDSLQQLLKIIPAAPQEGASR